MFYAKNFYVRKFIHQSWLTVSLCAGFIIGVILVWILRWNFFASFWWVLFAFLLFIYAYLHPIHAFIIIAFIAGMVIGFFRTTEVLMAENNQGVNYFTWVEDVRDWFAIRIKQVVPEPEVNLGISYLLGMRENLPDDLSNSLKSVGLAHIVVASGAHLSILVEVARKLFSKISRFAGALFSLLFIIFFMAMVGFTSSILRAGIMAILTILFGYTGRKFAPWRIILLTMTITLLIDPAFIGELGWLLSFASYTGIMILGPLMTQFLYGGEKVRFIPATILATLAATLMTLPITLYYFGSISIISVVANLLILPTLPYVMGLTFFSGVFQGVPILSELVGLITTKIIDFHILIINFLGEESYFIATMPKYNGWIFLLYLPILTPFAWLLIRQKCQKVVKLREV